MMQEYTTACLTLPPPPFKILPDLNFLQIWFRRQFGGDHFLLQAMPLSPLLDDWIFPNGKFAKLTGDLRYQRFYPSYLSC